MAPRGYQARRGPRSWGRAHSGGQHVAEPRFTDRIPTLMTASGADGLTTLAVGLGRSYGDSGLNLGQAAIDMSRIDRLLAFDPVTGILRAEAGLSLGEAIRRVVPFGWFPATTPGTQFVTLGGAVANDVHGKNHHRAGTFGASVRRLGLWRSDLGEIEVSRHLRPDLFAATVGGLGLTGIMLWVEIQLARIGASSLDVETIPFGDVGEFLDLAQQSEAGFEHTVAWVDCLARGLGRGIFTRANWRDDGVLIAHDDRRRAILPLDLPGFVMNPLSLGAFNLVYRQRALARPPRSASPYAPYFYPLDAIGGWNRAYGPRGFFQHQCVTPMQAGMAPILEMLASVARAGDGVFLAVIKTFGDVSSPGLLSFPRRGVTLALDFANRGTRTLAMLARLDEIVLAAGGRIYPAKDGRMSAKVFRAGYPQLARFAEWVDPALSSSFWRRMGHG